MTQNQQTIIKLRLNYGILSSFFLADDKTVIIGFCVNGFWESYFNGNVFDKFRTKKWCAKNIYENDFDKFGIKKDVEEMFIRKIGYKTLKDCKITIL